MFSLRNLTFATLAITTLTLAPLTPAQELPTPGPAHDVLKKMEGTWDATVQMQGNQSKGTATYKMDLGGLWLMTHFVGDFFGQKFEGRGMDTYDPATGKYVSVWADTMSTRPMSSEGTWDKEKKILTMRGKSGPEEVPFRSVIEFVTDDHMRVTMHMTPPGGTEAEFMTIDYRKKK